MTVIKKSREGTYAAITKALIILIIAWIVFSIIYSVIRSTIFTTPFEFIPGIPNPLFLFLVFIVSAVVVAVVFFVISELTGRGVIIETREKDILAIFGAFAPTEKIIPYGELREARIIPSFLEFIDGFFNVGNIAIEWERIIIIKGVKNPIDVMKEINDRIAASKTKITLEDVMKEVAELREEIERLKGRKVAKPTIPKEKEEEKKFRPLRPL